MKRLIMALLAGILLAGCNGDDIDTLDKEVKDLTGRVEALEKIMAALEQRDYVTSITPLPDGTGYTIRFDRTGEIVLRQGFSDIKLEGNTLVLTVTETGQTLRIPYQSPGFGFAAGTPDGPLTITLAETLAVTLPSEYQTVKAEIDPLDPGSSLTPARAVGTRSIAEVEQGDWEVSMVADALGTGASVIIRAERPYRLDALLSIHMVDGEGITHTLRKLIRRDPSPDYVYDAESNTYTVKSANGLMMVNKILYALVNDRDQATDRVNVTLAADIVLKGDQNWTTVADKTTLKDEYGMTNVFNGTFNGNGYTITGLDIQTEDKNGAMFEEIGEEGVVKNLIFETFIVKSSYMAAVVACGNNGLISNCTLKSSDLGLPEISADWMAGGFAGWNNGVIECCNIEYSGISISATIVGGIVANNVSESGIVRDCTVRGYHEFTGTDIAGGIAGDNSYIVTGCTVTTNTYVKGACYLGGIVGRNFTDGVVQGCTANKLHIIYKEYYTLTDEMLKEIGIGGIAGWNAGALVCNYSTNLSIRKSPVTYGGIVGRQEMSYRGSTATVACYCNLLDGQSGIAGIFGKYDGPAEKEGDILQCYFLPGAGLPLVGFDSDNSTLATIWDDSAETGDGAMKRMNAAIDRYNQDAEMKCEYRWGGEGNEPTLH